MTTDAHRGDDTGLPISASTTGGSEFSDARDWIEVIVRDIEQPDELIGILDDADVAGAWDEGTSLHLYWPASRWSADTMERLTAVVRRCGPRASIPEVTRLQDRDWNAQWARAVRPVRVGRVLVRPSWVRDEILRPGDIELVIDPKQAFGTGHHATTQLLLRWIQDVIRSGERVLDVGTGSGILAMAALRLGAGSAVGLDIDPVAIDCAREYAGVNGFGPELRLDAAAFGPLPGEYYDIVLANLDRRTILVTVPALLQAVEPGGVLLLSGILQDDESEVAAALAQNQGEILERRKLDGWLALAVGGTRQR